MELPRVRAEYLWIRDIFDTEGCRGLTFAEPQVRVDQALDLATLEEMFQEPHHWPTSGTSSQQLPAENVVRYEFSQESLGLTASQRRTEIFEKVAAQRPVVAQALHLRNEPMSAFLGERASRIVPPLAQREGQIQHFLQKSRYQRACMNEMRCGHQSLCQRSGIASVAADNCVDWTEGDTTRERDVNSIDSQAAAAHQVPEGDQRLDWDTDLVRRLFGEIE